MRSQLQRQFGEDATALVELLSSAPPLRPSNVRVVTAAVVCKWLLDGQLNLLANALGGTLELPAVDTTAVSEIARDPNVVFFLAGGVMLGGEVLRGLYVSDAPYVAKPPISGEALATTFFRPSRYLKSPRVFYQGQWFTAQQVISFVANKHGGVHLDPSRKYEWQAKLEAASQFFFVGNPERLQTRQIVERRPPQYPKHTILLVLPREIGVIWTCLEIELLSTAQALVNVRFKGEPLLEWQRPEAVP